MSYVHTGKAPTVFRNDPIDPDSQDWVFFIYDAWLRSDETITSHAAIISGGTILTDSVSLGATSDEDGTIFQNVYGVEVEPLVDAKSITLTHRISTSTSGVVDLGRTDIDHSVIIPIVSL